MSRGAKTGKLLLDAFAGLDAERLPPAVLVKLVGEAGEQHVDLGALRREVGDAVDRDLRGSDPVGRGIGSGLPGGLVAEARRFVHHERDQHVLLLREATADRLERRRVRRRAGCGVRRRARQHDGGDRENRQRDETPGAFHLASAVAIDHVCNAATMRPRPATIPAQRPNAPPET